MRLRRTVLYTPVEVVRITDLSSAVVLLPGRAVAVY